MTDLTRSTTPPHGHATLGSTEKFSGALIGVRTDDLRTGPDHRTTFDIVEHPGASAVVALDGEGRVLLVRQWRQAISAAEWELPAGVRDRDGAEAPREAAERELAEETGVTASSWRPLLTLHTSPGVFTERVEIYLATGARVTDRPHREPTEAAMTTAWVPLPDAVAAIRSGDITSAMTVAGLLAVAGPTESLA